MRRPSVHVIVLNWNRWRDTEECLDSLDSSTYPCARVTLVDNASTDGSPECFAQWLREGERRPAPDRFDLLRNDENLGFAEGNNRGIAYALEEGAAWILILNNDTVVEPGALSEMVSVAEASGAAMVAPAVYDDAQRDRVDRFGIVVTRSGAAYDRLSENDGPLFCPSGCAALYRRDLAEALALDPGGFFDRRFFMYHEDVDVGFRAWARGYRPAFAGRARVYHKGSATLGLGSPQSYYLRHRNTLWAVAKNYSTGLLLREIPYLLAGQLLGVVNAVRRRRLRAVLKGKLEGVWGSAAIRRGAPATRTHVKEGFDTRFALTRRARMASVGSGAVSARWRR